MLVDGEAVAPPEERAGHVFLVYRKPPGVVCTTDPDIPGNVVAALRLPEGFPRRVFPVGRLDKDSTGVLLLTSCGAFADAALRGGGAKEYEVEVGRRVTEGKAGRMRGGVVITTTQQRDGGRRVRTAPTDPCEVEVLKGGGGTRFRIVLREGRNRQIRRMAKAVGLGEVLKLERVGFLGVGAGDLEEGGWRHLDEGEMEVVKEVLEGSASRAKQRRR